MWLELKSLHIAAVMLETLVLESLDVVAAVRPPVWQQHLKVRTEYVILRTHFKGNQTRAMHATHIHTFSLLCRN